MAKRRDDNGLYWRRLREAETQLLETALRNHSSVREAATTLGVSPNYVSERLAKLAIAIPKTKPGPKSKAAPPPMVLAQPTMPPMPTVSTEFFALVAENLLEVAATIANDAADPLADDCRFIADLVQRGVYMRREAAVLLHRIKVQRAFSVATRKGSKK